MKNNYRNQFPIFDKYPDLAYLDNAATTQRPKVVINAIHDFYAYENSNIHRGVYDLSNRATQNYEATRLQIAQFLGSENPNTIAFTKGTTESVNIVANSFLGNTLKEGDNVVTSIMEHHGNFIPWQKVAQQNKVEFRVIPIDKNGDLDVVELNNLIDSKTKLLSINHISNTLGTINPIEEIIDLAHKKGIPVMVDAAQSAAYYSLNQKEIQYDFLAFSAHKLFGPFGIGVLYVADKYIDRMTPYNVGGGMIKDVTIEGTLFNEYPFNMDAGTSNIGGVRGLSAAVNYTSGLNRKEVQDHLNEVTSYGLEKLKSINGVSVLGNPKKKSGIISFTIDDIHPHDIASFLNQDNIAVRAGMHCTQPLLDSLSTPATVRASFSMYNTKEEVDKLEQSIKELINFWS